MIFIQKITDLTKEQFDEFIKDYSIGLTDLEELFNLDTVDFDYKINLSYDKYKPYITQKYLRPYIEKVTEDIKNDFTNKGIDKLLEEYLDIQFLNLAEIDYYIKRGKNVLAFRDNIFIEDTKIDMSDECTDEINILLSEINTLGRIYGALTFGD